MSAQTEIMLSGSRPDRAGLIIGPLAILAILLALAGRTGSPMHAGLDALIVLVSATPWVLAWLAAAAGLGWPLRVWLAVNSHHGLALQLCLGIAAMLWLIAATGRIGVLHLGGSAGAWLLLSVGLGLLSVQSVRAVRRQTTVQLPAPPVLIWAAAPAIAVLLLASASAPGWLWDSEFGGYDVLSYHLQLPKEWMSIGQIVPLEHNVYSFLPSYMEGAYYHLALMQGDAIRAVYAAQLLHAALAVITALVTARLVTAWTRTSFHGASVAGVVVLGTPWVIVVGSLAYNEMAAALMLAAGLLACLDENCSPLRRGAMVGLFAAAACGAKLTSVGFVAAPLGAALMYSLPWRMWLRAIATGCAFGAVMLTPYALGNLAATGNPVFPFATSLFGTGHWNHQQVEIWSTGHASSLPLLERLIEAWNQLMRYGIGENPYMGEPWFAQWSILPWLAIGAAVLVLFLPSRHDSRPVRPLAGVLVGMVFIQFAFWLLLTHIKSRFMVPMVVPAAGLVGLAWCVLGARWRVRDGVFQLITMGALVLWCSIPAVIFASQAGGSPAGRIGMAHLLSGLDLSESERRQIGQVQPTVFLNDLPKDSRVLLIGEAAPLYLRIDYAYQTTWDRGPMSRVMDEHDDPTAWATSLRNQGFTHVFINTTMLQRWEDASWNDPRLTEQRVREFAERHAIAVQSWPTGERLYQLQ